MTLWKTNIYFIFVCEARYNFQYLFLLHGRLVRFYKFIAKPSHLRFNSIDFATLHSQAGIMRPAFHLNSPLDVCLYGT